MYEITDLDKQFGTEYALRQFNLSIDEGEHLAVIGPSGAGKTTLFHLMAGLLDPDRGRILLGRRKITSLENGERSHWVGIMHQQFDLVDQLPVIHNVLAGRLGTWNLWQALRSLLFPREKQLAIKALERVGIPDKLYDKTAHLSGGEQQRVALARLLVQDPKVILADEPVASVDPARTRDLLEMLISIADEKNRTLVVSLHSVEYALEYFPRIVGMRAGEVVLDGSPNEIDQEQLDQLFQLPGESVTV